MNIFVLSQDPYEAAKFHADKHVPKMVLESAQMLSTVLDGPYKPTHKNHPCTLWAGESRWNALWLWMLMSNLNAEYQTRWGRDTPHKSYVTTKHLINHIHKLPDSPRTPFALAMPEEYKDEDPVVAYRAYYRSKPFVEWKHGAPEWW